MNNDNATIGDGCPVSVDGDIAIRLEKIEKSLASLSESLLSVVPTLVSWEEKTTDSGIDLSAGPTTVTKSGKLIGTASVQTGPTNITVMFLVQPKNSKQIAIVPATNCSIID